MTRQEWENKVKFYEDSISAIIIPPDTDPMNIIRLDSELDRVYSQARLDYAKAKIARERIQLRAKNHEKDAMAALLVLEKDPNIDKAQKPSNDKQREAWINTWLNTNPLPGTQITVMQAQEIYADRFETMQAIVDILREKRERLVTSLGCLKLDAELHAGKTTSGAERMANSTAAGSSRPLPGAPQ